MSVLAIYAPIEAELDLVLERLRELAQVDFPWLGQMLDHVLRQRGKQIRPALCLLSARFHPHDTTHVVTMAAAAELLHTATLVHDDTVDKSALRRGDPTVHSLWGDSTAILLGDYLFANSADLCTSTGNLRCVHLFARTVMTLCKGELNELFSAFDAKQDRQHYLQRIERKTASLFSMATEAGAVLSGAPEEEVLALRRFGHALGLAFQIVDDILDYMGTEEDLGKPVGNDLLQGTVTLPAILLLEREPADATIRRACEGPDREAAVREAVARIRDSGVIDEAYAIARGYAEEARRELRRLPSSPAQDSLHGLVDYVLDRSR
ncbi:MAG: polyprenyl synthetase family protein [Dehalococcoidia bacterium]|nr:polyprenyl synthetase family protein [Dehalococcoidia bacterium]